jgi:hypothetical protein
MFKRSLPFTGEAVDVAVSSDFAIYRLQPPTELSQKYRK